MGIEKDNEWMGKWMKKQGEREGEGKRGKSYVNYYCLINLLLPI